MPMARDGELGVPRLKRCPSLRGGIRALGLWPWGCRRGGILRGWNKKSHAALGATYALTTNVIRDAEHRATGQARANQADGHACSVRLKRKVRYPRRATRVSAALGGD